MDREQLFRVIGLTPLVSVDLVVRNDKEEVLLGYRTNRPAKDCWFVPGGRINKNERLQNALKRISLAELGLALEKGDLIGAFDHIYDDNFRGVEGVGTHYVVVAVACRLPRGASIAADAQHSEMRWWPVDELLAHPQVHPNTKLYFTSERANGFRCGG